MSEYENLLGHMQHHGIKKALLRMCDEEDANTIREAIERIPERRLVRRLARALTREQPRLYDQFRVPEDERG